MKKCSKCKEYKEILFFGKDKHTKDGYCSSCKECRKNDEKLIKWREENREYSREKAIKYYYEHHEERIKYSREYKLKNKKVSITKEKNKLYQIFEENGIKKKRCRLCEEIKNIESFPFSEGRYLNICKKCDNKRRNDNRQKRIKEKPFFKIRDTVSRSIRKMLKQQNSKKKDSCFKYLPYTLEQLKEHLESQFEEWMSWNNYGGNINNPEKTWWIDHIIPQSILPYDSMEHPNFLKCWSLENLRPLEKNENVRKGDFIEKDWTTPNIYS